MSWNQTQPNQTQLNQTILVGIVIIDRCQATYQWLSLTSEKKIHAILYLTWETEI